MKAAVFSEYSKDPAKVVKITEIDRPKLKSNEVMIKVESAAFNYNDLWAVWGEPIKIPLPHISGTDIAGTVTDIGSAVTTIKVGDRVVSHANLSCRTCYLCTSGREYDCNSRLVWGFQTGPLWGGFAQFAKLPEVNVVKLPSGISFNDAASHCYGRINFLAYVSRQNKNCARSVYHDYGWHKWGRNGRNSDCKII